MKKVKLKYFTMSAAAKGICDFEQMKYPESFDETQILIDLLEMDLATLKDQQKELKV